MRYMLNEDPRRVQKQSSSQNRDNGNLVRWRKRKDPTCPLWKGRQTTVHVFRSCIITLSQRQYTGSPSRIRRNYKRNSKRD